MPEDINPHSNLGEFESPLDSPDRTPEPEAQEVHSPSDRKAGRKAQAKAEAVGSYDALIENARNADVPGMAEALADLEAAKNIREQTIENGMDSLFEAKESTIKQVLKRVVDFMHGDAKEVVALSSDDINKLASIAVDYTAYDGETRQYQPFDKVEDTADMINATTKTLGITFPAESMKMLTNILDSVPGPGGEYSLTVTTGGLDGGHSFKKGSAEFKVDDRSSNEAAREKSPLVFDSNLGFRVEIDRKYNTYRKMRLGTLDNRELVREERVGAEMNAYSEPEAFQEEYADRMRDMRNDGHTRFGVYDREFSFEIKLVRKEETDEA